MSKFLSPEAIEHINQKHARQLKMHMLEALANGFNEEAEARPDPDAADSELDEDAGGSGYGFEHRRAPPRDKLQDMLAMEDGENRKYLSMKEIMRSTDAQHNAVLRKPWYVGETSNRDRVLAQYLVDNIDTLIKQVPLRCKDFELLAVQRAAILAMTNAMPHETYTELEITRDSMKEITAAGARKQPFKVNYNIEAGALPVFTIADYCTGSGKTIMAIMAALMLLCCREQWDTLKRDYKNILRARIRETHSGLCKGESVSKGKLARLAVMFVPSNMLTHWYKTAQSAVFGCKEVYGQELDVVVWKGEAGYHSVREAHESGNPTLWILPMEPDSMKPVRASPDIGYAVRIFDELNMPMRTRYDQMESSPMFTYVTQATIEALAGATVNMPRHPVRLAFGDNYAPISRCKAQMRDGNYRGVQIGLEHFCKLRQFAAPEFLRRLVAEGVQQNMPAGLIIHKLELRAGTLAAVVTGSDIVRFTLPELAVSLLGSGVMITVKDRVKELFGRAELLGSSEILTDLDTELEKMPERSLADNAAKNAVMRLRDRMREILGTQMPECPITMAPIKPENVRILKCCTAVLDANSIPTCRGKCPLCRASFGEHPDVALAAPDTEKAAEMEAEAKDKKADKRKSVLKYDKSQTTLSPSLRKPNLSEENGTDDEETVSKRKKPVASDPASCDAADGPSNEGVNPAAVEAERIVAFEESVAEISARKPYCVDGILEALGAQVKLKPSSRILLCFGFERHQKSVVRDIVSRIQREIPNALVSDIDMLARDWAKADAAKVKFDNTVKYPVPNVFVINTNVSSSSVQGLDLHATDLTVVADRCSLPTQRQAAGRSLRMRKRPRNMGADDRFPPKRILVASIRGAGA